MTEDKPRTSNMLEAEGVVYLFGMFLSRSSGDTPLDHITDNYEVLVINMRTFYGYSDGLMRHLEA